MRAECPSISNGRIFKCSNVWIRLGFSAKENFCEKIKFVRRSENDAEFREKKTKYATISRFFFEKQINSKKAKIFSHFFIYERYANFSVKFSRNEFPILLEALVRTEYQSVLNKPYCHSKLIFAFLK